MVKFYPSITPELESWVPTLPIFYTASAPLAGAHVNISPKGAPAATLRILGPNLCAYLDCTGSGAETIAHIYENGRVTIMFCDFGPSPRICRFFCTGRVVEWDQRGFTEWVDRVRGDRKVEEAEGVRAVVVLDVWKVQTSCGYGVPVFNQKSSSSSSSKPRPMYLPTNNANLPPSPSESDSEEPVKSVLNARQDPPPVGKKDVDSLTTTTDDESSTVFVDRPTLSKWARSKIERNELHDYQKVWNGGSLDGCPGMKVARRDRGERWLWWGDGKARAKRVWSGERGGLAVGIFVGILTVLLVQGLGTRVQGRGEMGDGGGVCTTSR